MNLTHNFINLFVLRGKDGNVTQWRISSLVILSLAVSLVALAVYAGISAGDNSAALTDRPSLSENPELKVAQRHAESALKEIETNRFAVNPELKYAERYRQSGLERMETASGNSNPELNVHQRFMEASERANALSFQYANPELKIHQRFVELSQGSE